jgi:hypothetical protein
MSQNPGDGTRQSGIPAGLVRQPWSLGIPRTVAVVLGFLSGLPDAEAAGRRIDPKTAAALQASWRGCFSPGSPVPEFSEVFEEEESGTSRDVRRTRSGFRVSCAYSGNGVEAGHSRLELEFAPQGCRALWSDSGSYDGALAFHTVIRWINRDPPSGAEIARLEAAEPARPDDAAHGFPRAWLGHACPGGPASTLAWEKPVEGPIAPAQPWHSGTPLRAPTTFWPLPALSSIGARVEQWVPTEEDSSEDEGRPAQRPGLVGIWVPGTERPKRTFSAAGVDLFEAELPGRNSGRAIALFDPAGKRHRWVVATRGCVQGTTVAWLGTVGTRIIGLTHSRHPRYAEGDAILIIDVASGTAWAVPIPEAIREANLFQDDPPRARLKGSQLTLRAAKVVATVDLAPSLATIPAAP